MKKRGRSDSSSPIRSAKNLLMNSGCGATQRLGQTEMSFVMSITSVSHMPIRTLLSMVFPDGRPTVVSSISGGVSQMKYRSLHRGRNGYLGDCRLDRLSSGTTNSYANRETTVSGHAEASRMIV